MELVKKLFREKKPFAMIQYFACLKTSKSEKNKVYEIIYFDKSKRIKNLLLNDNDSINMIKNHNEVEIVVKTNDGCVYEYNHFKQLYDEIKPKKQLY